MAETTHILDPERAQVALQVLKLRVLELVGVAQKLRFACGLVDDGSSVDDADETPRETACDPVSSAVGESEEPDGDDRRLAETGRDVAALWKVPFDEPFIQRALPVEPRVSGQRVEEGIEARPIQLGEQATIRITALTLRSDPAVATADLRCGDRRRRRSDIRPLARPNPPASSRPSSALPPV